MITLCIYLVFLPWAYLMFVFSSSFRHWRFARVFADVVTKKKMLLNYSDFILMAVTGWMWWHLQNPSSLFSGLSAVLLQLSQMEKSFIFSVFIRQLGFTSCPTVSLLTVAAAVAVIWEHVSLMVPWHVAGAHIPQRARCSFYGRPDTVHASNICFIFSRSRPRHSGVAAEIMLPCDRPLSRFLK